MHEVWKLFSELTLPKDLLDYLYLKVESIPSSIYDEKFVEFAKILTDKAVLISNEARRMFFFGHSILFIFILAIIYLNFRSKELVWSRPFLGASNDARRE